jgi:hypothetical protein
MSALVSIIDLKSDNFDVLPSFYGFLHDNGLSYGVSKLFIPFFANFISFFVFFGKINPRKCVT